MLGLVGSPVSVTNGDFRGEQAEPDSIHVGLFAANSAASHYVLSIHARRRCLKYVRKPTIAKKLLK